MLGKNIAVMCKIAKIMQIWTAFVDTAADGGLDGCCGGITKIVIGSRDFGFHCGVLISG